MKALSTENFSQYLTDRDEQKRLFKARSLDHVIESVPKSHYSGTPPEGWYLLDDKLKTKVKIAKKKAHDEFFEDQLWCLFHKMGFKYLSKTRDCRISYSSKQGNSQQIDVFAVDDECAFVVECKSSKAESPIASNFKTELEAMEGRRAGINKSIKDLFGVEGMKVGYIFATENYNRMEALRVKHFGKAEIECKRPVCLL